MKMLCQPCFAVLTTGLLAAAAAAQQELPTAQEVVDRFVEVTGGKDKYAAVKTMTAQGKYHPPGLDTIDAAGAEGTIEIFFSQPDKARVNVDIPNFGKVERGQLGKIAWEINPLTGTRLLEGEEAQRFLAGLDMKATFDPASLYESLENEGIEEVEGEPCYKVTMKRKGSEDTDVTYYSVKTGLAVKSITREPSQFGKITIHTVFSEYEDVDGIKSAMNMKQEIVEAGATQEIDLETIKYNAPIDDAVFELPASVQELAKDRQ